MIPTIEPQEKQEITSQDATSERTLWLAVLALALEDWMQGNLRVKREAQYFLFEDDSDYFSVCASAGVDGDSFRSKLLKIGRRVQMKGSLPYPAAA